MKLNDFIKKIRIDPESIEFTDTIAVIDSNYQYTPTSFSNGNQNNKAGENEGSCKILAFAYLNNLTITETLNCFGNYYRDDVLGNPAGDDHQNIRQFILDGFEGVAFEAMPLQFNG